MWRHDIKSCGKILHGLVFRTRLSLRLQSDHGDVPEGLSGQ